MTNVVEEQVFEVDDKKGWGIRTLEQLSRGCFVFEYVGEVVTNAELLTRGVGDKYSLALDAHWQSEVNEGDESLLSINASMYSNVARWLNHRYDAGLHGRQKLIFIEGHARCLQIAALLRCNNWLFFPVQVRRCELDGHPSVH